MVEATKVVEEVTPAGNSAAHHRTLLEQQCGRRKTEEYTEYDRKRTEAALREAAKVDGEIVPPPTDGRVQERFSNSANKTDPIDGVNYGED